MAFALKYFVIFLLLSMVSQGLCRCSFGDIQIGTVRTGAQIAGQPEWKVTVINTCNCPQRKVILSCGGFAPVKPVSPWLLRSEGNKCILVKSGVLPAGGTAEFTYAGQPYIFRPIGSEVDPSCNH